MTNANTDIATFGRNIVKTEGLVKGLWKPGVEGHAIGVGFCAVGRVGMYPFVRDAILRAYGAKPGEKPLAIMTLSGFIAGMIGSVWGSAAY